MKINNVDINEILNEELEDIILFVKQSKADRMIGQAVDFDWRILRGTHEQVLEINLEGYNPIRMKFMITEQTFNEKELRLWASRYKNLLFRHTTFGR